MIRMQEVARPVVLPRLAALLILTLLALASSERGSSQDPSGSGAAGPGAAIVLPQKMVAGQSATLAVLDAAGRLTRGAVVEFSGGERVTTDATGRATFTAPVEAGVLLAHLPDAGVSASAVVISPPANAPDGVQVFGYPRISAAFDRFAVDGSGFGGEADANRAVLGERPALVLAASPVSLVLLPGPHATQGPTQLLIEVRGRSPGPMPVTLVALEVQAPRRQLAPREKAKLAVRVRGSDQRLAIEVRNLTPEVVELTRGNVQRVTSSGGANNTAAVELKGVRVGDFSVSARLVPGGTGLPDIESARQRLLVARRAAPSDWQARVDRVISLIERNPQDVSRVRDELERMLALSPPGEFGRLLEAAWRELLKR